MEKLFDFILNPPDVIPELVVKIADTVIFVTISLAIFYTLAIKPISYFIYKNLNKTYKLKKQLLSIIKNNSETYKSFDKDYIEELKIIEKMAITECLDRKLASYFYNLTNMSTHMIPYNKFKRIYSYLSIYSGEILLDYKRIKSNNRWSSVLAYSLFLLMIIFAILVILSHYNAWVPMVFMGIFEVLGLLVLDMKIKKNEINQFIETASKYRNDLQSTLNGVS